MALAPGLRLPSQPGWPVRLRYGALLLRPLWASDQRAWRELRQRNQAWTGPWDATLPPEAPSMALDFDSLRAGQDHEGRAGRAVPLVMALDPAWERPIPVTQWGQRRRDAGSRLIGQVGIANLVRGAAQSASIGYWIDQAHAGRGLTPLAVAMALDYSMAGLRLHRVEICIRPENAKSLRVADKLGLAHEGSRPGYLHIAGRWTDHEVFVLYREQWPPGGLVSRLGMPAPDFRQT